MTRVRHSASDKHQHPHELCCCGETHRECTVKSFVHRKLSSLQEPERGLRQPGVPGSWSRHSGYTNREPAVLLLSTPFHVMVRGNDSSDISEAAAERGNSSGEASRPPRRIPGNCNFSAPRPERRVARPDAGYHCVHFPRLQMSGDYGHVSEGCPPWWELDGFGMMQPGCGRYGSSAPPCELRGGT